MGMRMWIRGSVRASIPHQCAACGASGASKRCWRCREARYCDADCQKSHWPAHKAKGCAPAPANPPKATTSTPPRGASSASFVQGIQMPPDARFVWACPVGTESQLAAVRAAVSAHNAPFDAAQMFANMRVSGGTAFLGGGQYDAPRGPRILKGEGQRRQQRQPPAPTGADLAGDIKLHGHGCWGGGALQSATGMADCGLNPSAMSSAAAMAALMGRPLGGVLESTGMGHGSPWGMCWPSLNAREQTRDMPQQLPRMVAGNYGRAQLTKMIVARGWEDAAAYLRTKAVR
ncbi:hypothetical protein FOA52_005565 [Chlamydomonas sp. UWO 241]|nr:hypothetical protein FOA52_005565 [Chlamydomonas sp. UWO 241]